MKTFALLFFAAMVLSCPLFAQFHIKSRIYSPENDTNLRWFYALQTQANSRLSKNYKKWALDSISNYDSQKVLQSRSYYYYDEYGMDTGIIFTRRVRSWRPPIPTDKERIKYYKNGQFKELYNYEYHEPTKKWRLLRFMVFTYSADSSILTQTHYYYDHYNARIDTGYKFDYHIDSLNYIDQIVYSNYISGCFEPIFKQCFSYDSLHRFSLEVDSIWNSDSAAYFPIAKYIQQYSGSNTDPKLGYRFFWNQYAQRWDVITKNTYSYNAKNLLEKSVSFNVPYQLVTAVDSFTYDEYDFPYEYITKVRYSPGATLAFDMWHRRINNQFGDDTCYYIRSWDTLTNSWQPLGLTKTQYNLNVDRDNICLPYYFRFWSSGVKMPVKLSYYGYTELVHQWVVYEGESIYHYSLREVLHLTNETKSKSAKVYPNPAYKQLNIDLPEEVRKGELQIYDLNGKLLIRMPYTRQKPVEIEELAPGLYLFVVETSNSTYSGKFIVER